MAEVLVECPGDILFFDHGHSFASSSNVRNGSNADIAEVALMVHRGLVTWLFRRLIGPFVVGAIVCTALLLVWITVVTDQRPIGLFDVKFVALIVLPFEALGLALFLPVALALRRRALTELHLVLLLALIGAAVGMLVTSPLMFPEAPRLGELALPAVFGLVSALVWSSMNRDAFRYRA